jgi:hypothetical protein
MRYGGVTPALREAAVAGGEFAMVGKRSFKAPVGVPKALR